MKNVVTLILSFSVLAVAATSVPAFSCGDKECATKGSGKCSDKACKTGKHHRSKKHGKTEAEVAPAVETSNPKAETK